MKFKHLAIAAIGLLAFSAPLFAVHAEDDDDDEGRGGGSRAVTDTITKKECGDCHIAFPPGLLPSASWERIMDNLSNHFGENASLDPQTTQHIRAYLSASGSRRGDASKIRITEQSWFSHEHRTGFLGRITGGPKSFADCKACHRDAERGMFDDD